MGLVHTTTLRTPLQLHTLHSTVYCITTYTALHNTTVHYTLTTLYCSLLPLGCTALHTTIALHCTKLTIVTPHYTTRLDQETMEKVALVSWATPGLLDRHPDIETKVGEELGTVRF
jgi:hypothetical protein